MGTVEFTGQVEVKFLLHAPCTEGQAAEKLQSLVEPLIEEESVTTVSGHISGRDDG